MVWVGGPFSPQGQFPSGPPARDYMSVVGEAGGKSGQSKECGFHLSAFLLSPPCSVSCILHGQSSRTHSSQPKTKQGVRGAVRWGLEGAWRTIPGRWCQAWETHTLQCSSDEKRDISHSPPSDLPRPSHKATRKGGRVFLGGLPITPIKPCKVQVMQAGQEKEEVQFLALSQRSLSRKDWGGRTKTPWPLVLCPVKSECVADLWKDAVTLLLI